jgi:hypothetical protein
MKKIMMMAAIVALCTAANAATVSWKYTGSSDQEGYSMYVFTSAVAEHYDTFADLINGNIDVGNVEAVTGRTTSYQVKTRSSESNSMGSSLYFVLVEGSSAETFKYGTVDVSSYKYDPAAQETSPGTLALTSANFTGSGTIGAVPEPTSGLLMLLGVAGLALRRRRA